MNNYQDGRQINDKGHLEIAGLDTIDLANNYGTPLLIYNISTVRENIKMFKDALKSYPKNSEVSYASKAFSSVAMYQIIEQEDISIDVVSGENYTLQNKLAFQRTH